MYLQLKERRPTHLNETLLRLLSAGLETTFNVKSWIIGGTQIGAYSACKRAHLVIFGMNEEQPSERSWS